MASMIIKLPTQHYAPSQSAGPDTSKQQQATSLKSTGKHNSRASAQTPTQKPPRAPANLRVGTQLHSSARRSRILPTAQAALSEQPHIFMRGFGENRSENTLRTSRHMCGLNHDTCSRSPVSSWNVLFRDLEWTLATRGGAAKPLLDC